MRTRKILFYSHDTFGLGHIRRTQKIANSIASESRSILIACASPKASSFASQPGIEYLNLPGFTKQITGEYTPRSLNIPTDEFVNLRANLLLSAVRSFGPDVVIIDKEPLGVKKELLPSLEYLRKYRGQCHIICGFRDILDEKDAVRKEWDRRDTERALRDFFDSIFIYGEREIFDFAREYSLPAEIASRLLYTGYIKPEESNEVDDIDFTFDEDSKQTKRPLVTFTLGGGGDGWEFLETLLAVYEHAGDQTDFAFNTIVLTGPFASQRLIQRARALADLRRDIKVATFTANPISLFRNSDLVISMGGYNTFTELACLRKFPLILPRVQPRREQLIRAQVFKNRNLCDYIHPDELNPESLIKKISEMLASDRSVPHFAARGLERISDHIDEVLK